MLKQKYTHPNFGIQLCLSQYMMDQMSNLGLTLLEGVRTISFNDEGGIDLSTPKPHSQSFVPIRASQKVDSSQKEQTFKKKITTTISVKSESVKKKLHKLQQTGL